MNAVNVGLVRADHPVDMDKALVATLRRDLFGHQFAAIDKAFRVALTERDVAGGVLVEQGIEEQQAAFRDGRGVGHQRHFAQAARTFVGIEQLVQDFITAERTGFNDAPFLKANRDVVDQRALIGKWL